MREAENGEQAVSQFEQWQPHFIWMDMRMPVMGGYEATARIRALPGGDEVKIVALTASAFKEQHKSIVDAGCNQVVHKPYKSHEIFDVMAEELGVRYQYADGSEQSISENEQVSVEAIEKLPVELVEELRQTAISLSNEKFEQVLEQVRGHDPVLADQLERLAHEYRFDAILELLPESGKSND